MIHMKFKIIFHNIQEKKRWMHINISDVDRCKLEKNSVQTQPIEINGYFL